MKYLYSALFVFFCLALPVHTLAQGPPDPEDTPVDGGLALLLAAGVAYGVKSYRNRNEAQKPETELK